MVAAAGLSLAFFLSGAAGLIFQVVWFHRAGLVFGSSLVAVTIVLSSFMGGLALGNALAGSQSPQSRLRLRVAPLTVYAALELLVAASGVAVTYLLPHLTVILRPLTLLFSAHLWAVNLVRLASAFGVLVLPATAMGATFPVLVGAVSAGGRRFCRVLGLLYGWNTFGAVLGVVVAEVVLVDRLGVPGAAWVAAAFNLAAAALALAAGRIGESRASQPRDGKPDKGPTQHPAPSMPVRLPRAALLASALLAGASLLALEVVWFRFLTMYVLSTTLAASLMLAVVLAGIGLGGFAASVAANRAPERAAIVAALLCGIAVVASYAGFRGFTSGAQVGNWRTVLWFACVLTGPASMLSGVLFTALGGALREVAESDTTAAAALTVANTTGALCGAPLAGFALLPGLGMERTFFVLAALYLGIAALLVAAAGARRVMRRWPVVVTSAAAALALLLFPFGSMKDAYFLRAAAPYADDGSRIVATREGRSETIFLMQQQWMGRPVYNRLVTNGFSMTGTAMPGVRYMRYFAYWPMLLHQGPIRHALVVCYGLGVTAGAVLDVPGLESLDVAEISPDIVAMSDVVYQAGGHPLRDPRARLHLEDGRYFLATSGERFDLITGEPPPPRTPGAVNIYTREYFQLVHDRLADGGMTTYWLPVARPQPGTDVDAIVRAFCDVFADCSLWNATPFDLMLVGSKPQGGPVADEQFRAAWQVPALQAKLTEVGFERPEQIAATFVGDSSFVRDLVSAAPPLTDDFPHRLIPDPSRPSLSAPSSAIDRAASDRFARVIDPGRARDAFLSSPFIKGLWPAVLREKSAPFFAWQRMINRVIWEGGKPLAQIEDLHSLLTQSSLRTLPLWMLGSDEVKERIAETSAQQTPETEYARGLRALSGRDYRSAFDLFLKTEQGGLRAPTIRALLVYALCLDGRLDDARLFSRGIVAQTPDEQHFWDWLEKTYEVRRN
jgi:spermidine synthase